MDFTNLLNKEIKKKKQSHKTKSKKLKSNKTLNSVENAKVDRQDLTNKDPEIIENNNAELVTSKDSENQEVQLTEDKIDERLKQLNGLDENLTKDQKFERLQYLLQLDIQNKKYKAWLDKEEEYYQDPTKQLITLESILAAETKKLILRIQIRICIKTIIKEWENNAKTEEDKALLKETKKGLLKLLYKLRTDKLSTDMLVSLSTIFYYLQTNSFNKANESYMKLSIGNVCWPIGVVNVGIHARSSSSRITGIKNVSNIMINESTRRWIISIKRLINYKEKIYKESQNYQT
ncbi:uncharacterized protein KGF55_004507 [Candida pseudojiufengensis]|uniref:uncharacterized protein n=1 Tax=Candida pseudojiufengensis TaxID=497109 RepID=UPI002225B1CE|nr:uncharacterized protein KGF55_004507 [Candida pseudojiufengensis]KAI5960614.1 hypothetical protein KGF55_004507 [Candida pseudojiufengensis]